MTFTTLVPDWNATDGMSSFAAGRKRDRESSCRYMDWTVHYIDVFDCDAIVFGSHLERLPVTMSELPLQAIVIMKPNSPVTRAEDGPYEDGEITARVETYIECSVPRQRITVTGRGRTTLGALNRWFDDLLAGEKANYNLRPITYTAAPAPSDGVGTD